MAVGESSISSGSLEGITTFRVLVPYPKEEITRENWKDYVETLRINENWPGIQGMGFSIPLKASEKETHCRYRTYHWYVG